MSRHEYTRAIYSTIEKKNTVNWLLQPNINRCWLREFADDFTLGFLRFNFIKIDIEEMSGYNTTVGKMHN